MQRANVLGKPVDAAAQCTLLHLRCLAAPHLEACHSLSHARTHLSIALLLLRPASCCCGRCAGQEQGSCCSSDLGERKA